MFQITEIQSFPSIIWYKDSFTSSYINIIACENWRKMSFRNRYMIAGSNGVISLSVPVDQGRNQKAVLRDVKISYRENWQKVHWVSIVSCYNRSPFFEYYRDELEMLFTKKWNYLLDWDIETIFWLNRMLGYPGEVRLVDDLTGIEPSSISDLRDRYLPKNYQEADINVVYPQVFEDRTGFLPNLSTLDLLCNTGPGAKKYLQ